MSPRSFRPLHALCALIFLVAVLTSLILGEQPSGTVEGTAVSEVTGIPLYKARVVLTNLDDEAPVQVRRGRTDKAGHFRIDDVPTGLWELSASTQAHSAHSQTVRVEEGKILPVSVSMERSQPEFEAAPVQRTFPSASKPFLPLRGYVDRKSDVAHLTVYKTKLSDLMGLPKGLEDLRKAGDRYQVIPKLPDSLLKKAVLVKSWDEPLSKADGEGFYEQRVPLPAEAPGLYLIQASHGTDAACSWINVTDLALVVKRGKSPDLIGRAKPVNSTDADAEDSDDSDGSAQMEYKAKWVAFVADIKTGKPVPGAVVRRPTQNNPNTGADTTDASGLVSLTNMGQSDENISWVASRGGSEAVLMASNGSLEGRGNYVVSTYTERPIYRPGDTIFFKGIVRKQAPQTGGGQTLNKNGYLVPKDQPVEVELRNDAGERLNQLSLKTNNFGSYWGSATLSSEASPGYYTLVSTIDGQETTTDVFVSAYRKPELTVTVTPDQPQIIRGTEASMTVDAKFYFGSPVAGGKVQYEIYRQPNWDGLDLSGDEDDTSWDESEGRDYYGEYVSNGEATLDDTGKAVIRFPTVPKKDGEKEEDTSSTPDTQSETWSVSVTVTDAADRDVEGTGKVNVVAGDFHLGLSADGSLGAPNEAKAVTLQTVAYDTKKPVAGQSITLQWGYDNWNKDSEAVEYENVGTRTGVTDSYGRANLEVVPPHSGDLKITATAQDKDGHAITESTSVWVVAPGEDNENYSQYSDLELLTNQKHYKAGEQARVLINAAEPANSALMTIEGDCLYRSWTVPLKGRSTEINFPVLASYGPNVTIAACFVRDGKFVQSTADLRVQVPQRQVQVQIQPDSEKHLPGERVSYTVTTKDSKGRPVAGEFSFAVVDEAIFALANDNPAILQEAFYPRRENSVQTENSLEVEYLGDVNKTSPEIKARRRFVDTAYWLPDGQTDARGQAKISFNLPDNLTAWRATAFAQTEDSAFGYGKSEVQAAKPFMVRMDRPRFAVEGDTLRLLATVHNDTGAAQKATIKLESGQLTSSDDLSKEISLDPGQNLPVEWRVTVGAQDATIKISGWTSDQKYTDAVEETLPVRPNGREVLTRQAGDLTPNTNLKFAITGEPSRARVQLRLAPSPVDAVASSFDYLLDYPYGCVEQTSSRMYPDLLAKRLIRLTHRTDLVPAAKADELSKMAADGVVRLTKMQHEGGGWGWWEYDAENEFLTAYALSTLALAREEGIAVPDELIKKGGEAAIKMASTLPQPAHLESKESYQARRRQWFQDQPVLLLAAAEAGFADQARPIRAGFNLKLLDSAALANTALLDSKLGMGRDAFDVFLSKGNEDGGTLFWEDDRPSWQSDSDDISITALGLRALLAYDPADPRAAKALRFLMARRTGECWESTRDTALVLAALVDYVQAHPEAGAASGDTAVTVNGQPWSELNVKAEHQKLTIEPPVSMLKPFNNEMGVKATGGYYALEVRETKPPATGGTLQPVVSKDVKITREILRVMPILPGKLTPPLQPLAGPVKSGDPVTIRLTIESPRALAYVQVEDTFPAGCEPTQRGSADISSGDEWDYWWDATVVRDDRIAFFTKSLSKGKHVIEYTLRAQTPGQYRVLPAFLAPMYAPELRAESGESAMTIE